MKAVAYEQYGNPDELHLVEIEKPVPKEAVALVSLRFRLQKLLGR